MQAPNWEPNSGQFLLMISTSDDGSDELRSFFIDLANYPGYDPFAAVTMELTAEGSRFRCRLLEIADATLVVTDQSYPSGTVGVKTYHMAGAFDYFRVYRR